MLTLILTNTERHNIVWSLLTLINALTGFDSDFVNHGLNAVLIIGPEL